MADTAGVAEFLWNDWISPRQKNILCNDFQDEQLAQGILIFLAGMHDIGKATPIFQIRLPSSFGVLSDIIVENGLDLPKVSSSSQKTLHALAGQVLFSNWIKNKLKDSSNTKFDPLAVIIGGHHGVPPTHNDILNLKDDVKRLGANEWNDVRLELTSLIEAKANLETKWDKIKELKITQVSQVLLSGLVIVADWVASTKELFPLVELGNPVVFCSDRVKYGWERLSLSKPWVPDIDETDVDKKLRRVFGMQEARPIQSAAFQVAHEMDSTGMMIIEAPMGEGKTEAALLAAEILAFRAGASGCMVALPTQATSNAMFDRLHAWLLKLPQKADSNFSTKHSVMLQHGKFWFNPTFQDLFTNNLDAPVAVGVDEGVPDEGVSTVQPYVSSWTVGRKKAALADFTVGTIDQLLFLSLKSRHLVLRHLGVSKKVVIVDEVHAYDAYMSVYLMRTIQWLGAYGVPVILLSATLSSQQRKNLLDAYKAYEQAKLKNNSEKSQRPATAWRKQDVAVDHDIPDHNFIPEAPYPRVTYFKNNQINVSSVQSSGRSLDVSIKCIPDSDEDLIRLLSEYLADGGCVLIIRNTVKRAQDTADHLRKIFCDDVFLIHSRFTIGDRQRKEQELLQMFSARYLEKKRPFRKIVVATQVLEQSLDLDFDLLVTDLCPIDLLLQRIGRLHRHANTYRPQKLHTPICLIAGVKDLDASPPMPVSGSKRVYGEYPLYVTLLLLRHIINEGSIIRLPQDISNLIEKGYNEDLTGLNIPDSWEISIQNAKSQHDKSRELLIARAKTYMLSKPDMPGNSILGWVAEGVTEGEENRIGFAQVRDTEEALEVILLMRDNQGNLHPVSSDERISSLVLEDQINSIEVVTAIASCSLQLPTWVLKGNNIILLIAELEKNFFEKWQSNSLLSGQLLLILDLNLAIELIGYEFVYSYSNGLSIKESNGNL